MAFIRGATSSITDRTKRGLTPEKERRLRLTKLKIGSSTPSLSAEKQAIVSRRVPSTEPGPPSVPSAPAPFKGGPLATGGVPSTGTGQGISEALLGLGSSIRGLVEGLGLETGPPAPGSQAFFRDVQDLPGGIGIPTRLVAPSGETVGTGVSPFTAPIPVRDEAGNLLGFRPRHPTAGRGGPSAGRVTEEEFTRWEMHPQRNQLPLESSPGYSVPEVATAQPRYDAEGNFLGMGPGLLSLTGEALREADITQVPGVAYTPDVFPGSVMTIMDPEGDGWIRLGPADENGERTIMGQGDTPFNIKPVTEERTVSDQQLFGYDGTDSGGDGRGGGGNMISPPIEPTDIPTYEMPLGLTAPAWYVLNPDWSKVPDSVRALVTFLNRLLPMFDPQDIPFLANLILSLTGGASGPFGRYSEASALPNFYLLDGVSIPDFVTRMTGATSIISGMPAAVRGLAQALLALAQSGRATRESTITAHAGIGDLLGAASEESRPYLGALQRLVEPTQLKAEPGSVGFTSAGVPYIVRNPALFTG